MTVYLTVQQALFLHMRLIEETGGAYGVRDLGLLQAAVARPQAVFARRELYPDLYSKAAALVHSLILNHPMVDGNKRLGVAAAVIFLERNRVQLDVDNAALEAFTLRVAHGGVEVVEIAGWLQQYARHKKPGNRA